MTATLTVEKRFVLPRLAVAFACLGWGVIHFQRHCSTDKSKAEARCPANGLVAVIYALAIVSYLFGWHGFGALSAAAFIFALTGQAAFCTCAIRPWKLDTLTKVVPLALALWIESGEPDPTAGDPSSSFWAW